MSTKLITIEDDIQNSNLNEELKKKNIELCNFLKDNDFLIEPENDGNGWEIIYLKKCVGHMNYNNVGIWIDTYDFGDSDAVNDTFQEYILSHVRNCEYFSSCGKQCGCGNQPGFNITIFGNILKNICFSHLEFISPDEIALDSIKKLMILFKSNVSKNIL